MLSILLVLVSTTVYFLGFKVSYVYCTGTVHSYVAFTSTMLLLHTSGSPCERLGRRELHGNTSYSSLGDTVPYMGTRTYCAIQYMPLNNFWGTVPTCVLRTYDVWSVWIINKDPISRKKTNYIKEF